MRPPKRSRLLAMLFGVFVVLGCERSEQLAGRSSTKGPTSGKPTVYVVNYPLQYFAERIAGDAAEVVFPAPADEDPAYWKPVDETIAAYQKADLILLNGALYARWVGYATLPASKVVDTSASFQHQNIEIEGAVTHAHGPEGEHAHGGVAFTTWLDMTLAVEQARAVKDALAKQWPEHKTRFEERFAHLEEDLEAVDTDIEVVVTSVSDRLVVFSHPVYQYFERRYGSSGKSVHWEPDQMPDEAMWAEFEELLIQHPATWMFWESEPDPEIVAKLREFGVESVVVNPCGNVPKEGDFLSVMRQNVAALRKAYATN